MGPWPPPTGRGPALAEAPDFHRGIQAPHSRGIRERGKPPRNGPRFCAGKGYTPRPFPNGAGPATPRPPRPFLRAGQAVPPGLRPTPRTSGSGRKTRSLGQVRPHEGRTGDRGKAHALLEMLSDKRQITKEAAQVMDAALAELVPLTSKTAACRILGKSRGRRSTGRRTRGRRMPESLPLPGWRIPPRLPRRKRKRSWKSSTATGSLTRPRP